MLSIPVLDDDTIIAMAAAGAACTALGVALGAAEVAESTIDVTEQVADKAGNVVETIVKVPASAAKFLGFGRKGGLF